MDLATPIIELVEKQDYLTLGDLTEGVHVTGQTGAGKTSGPGHTALRAFFEQGFGGLICCAKPGEAQEVIALADAGKNKRGKDIVLLGPGHQGMINILEYERRRDGATPASVVSLLEIIPQIAEGKRGPDGGDSFWPRTAAQVLRSAVAIMDIAGVPITLNIVTSFIATLATSPERLPPPQPQRADDAPPTPAEIEAAAKAEAAEDAAAMEGVAYPMIRRARRLLAQAWRAGTMDEVQEQSFSVADRYFVRTWPTLGDRVQGSIVATITSAFDMLQHGDAWRTLGNRTTIVPELSYAEGKIFVFDMDVATHGEVGRLCQCVFKYVWQRAMLRRRAARYPRPVFCYCDEAQYFITQFDFDFQSVARPALTCTWYMTQNLANYDAVMGDHAMASVRALLGHLTTHIYCANLDTATNTYAAERIGKRWQLLSSTNSGVSERGASAGSSTSWYEVYVVHPHEFGLLKRGGERYKGIVSALIHRAGSWNSNGQSVLMAEFTQQRR